MPRRTPRTRASPATPWPPPPPPASARRATPPLPLTLSPPLSLSLSPTLSAVLSLALALALVLAAAHVCGRLAVRLRQPAMVGEIVAGVVLGPSLLGQLPGDVPGLLFPEQVRPSLRVLAQLGLVLFMFGVGLRLDPAHLRGLGRQVTAVPLAAVALPFALGVGLAVTLLPRPAASGTPGDGLLGPALFLGVAMSITAFPVLARILDDRGLRATRIGALALACAALQDVLAWCVLAVVVALVHAGGVAALAWPAVRGEVRRRGRRGPPHRRHAARGGHPRHPAQRPRPDGTRGPRRRPVPGPARPARVHGHGPDDPDHHPDDGPPARRGGAAAVPVARSTAHRRPGRWRTDSGPNGLQTPCPPGARGGTK